jgi:hypothetical protein
MNRRNFINRGLAVTVGAFGLKEVLMNYQVTITLKSALTNNDFSIVFDKVKQTMLL